MQNRATTCSSSRRSSWRSQRSAGRSSAEAGNGRSERRLDHIDLDAGDRHHIEPDAVARPSVGIEPFHGQQPDPALLGRSDCGRGRTVAVVSTGLDLAEHHDAIAFDDEIEFSARRSPVAVEHGVAEATIVRCRSVLTPTTAGSPRQIRRRLVAGGVGLGSAHTALSSSSDEGPWRPNGRRSVEGGAPGAHRMAQKSRFSRIFAALPLRSRR